MSANLDFYAPQFFNFSNLDDLKTGVAQEEEYLENVENMGVDSSSEKKMPVTRKILQEIVKQETPDISSELKSSDIEKDIALNFESLKLCEAVQNKEEISLNSPNNEKNSSSTLDKRNVKKDLKCSSQQSLDSLHSEDSTVVSSTTSTYIKPTSKKRLATSPLSSAKKFISLAEQVEHFQKDTPDRFRSKPKNIAKGNRISRLPCIPKTPNLATKFRSRNINYPDEKKREELELEEIKKSQVKAYPLNEKILQGPCLNLKNPVLKKPITIPQPFSLTEVKKKEPQQEPVFHFKAQPVPKTILNGPVGIPQKKSQKPTVPFTPQMKVPKRIRVEVKTPDLHSSNGSISDNPQKTVVEPFSFDARMKEFLQKKEDFVKKVIEEEKKTFNSFKAHPMPSFKGKNDHSFKNEKTSHKTIVQPFNLTEPKGNKSFSENQTSTSKLTPFKAKPATVVHQKPFAPKLEKHEILPVPDFHLKTELRAAERQKFDEKIKQKEEENSLVLKLQKEEEEKIEKMKKLEERKKAEFKAKPVPKYKIFEVHGADLGKLTHPESPLFSSKMKKATQLHNES